MPALAVHMKCWNFFLLTVANMGWQLLLALQSLLKWLRYVRGLEIWQSRQNGYGVATGKTVLVTTGRQAKTLHTVRALKEIGARVIVTDYEEFSCSALSLSCDKFIVLPPLDTSCAEDWVCTFGNVLVENRVDMVLPVSTINEVLFVALAKKKLEKKLPHVTWICPDLENALLLDDRAQFSLLCEKFGVPTPEHGVVTSSDSIQAIADRFSNNAILKRIESSVNRSEEIIPLKTNPQIPASVKPTESDPWQWQRLIDGQEFSAWYVCIDGKVTFAACYISAPDLVEFDGVPIPEDVDKPLRKLISSMNLTGQFAFDFIRERKSQIPFVIECNPRASSILETVSKTPLWAEAFFGIDVIHRAVYTRIGFLFHKNCWPWASRMDGCFDIEDPLPFFCAEFCWPLRAVAKAGLAGIKVQKLDVNICKVIVSAPSSGRDLDFFRSEAHSEYAFLVGQSLRYMDTILLDASTVEFTKLREQCISAGRCVVPFSFNQDTCTPEIPSELHTFSKKDDLDAFVKENAAGETRLVLGARASKLFGSSSTMSYRVVDTSRSLEGLCEIPLRKIRVLHIMGSTASEYYEGISSYYGFQCIESIGRNGRFEHIIAYVHRSGLWSIGTNLSPEEIRETAPKTSAGEAISKIEGLMLDVAVPHMFDYDGLTAYRGLLRVLGIPMVGCSAEALALSTNKARTKACAAMTGVQVPQSQLLRPGDGLAMPLPVIIKPVEEDNSQGISIVRTPHEAASALDYAFQFGDEVLCEEFIPLGRELRVAVVESSDGEMEMLPIIEYYLSESSPIRLPSDKLTTNKAGVPNGLASGSRICPADVDECLKERLYAMSVTAHKALGCTDYSIYDYRIDPSGEPYMLESCLYCSFAPKSVLVSMQAAMGKSPAELFVRLCERAMTRKRSGSLSIQERGMK